MRVATCGSNLNEHPRISLRSSGLHLLQRQRSLRPQLKCVSPSFDHSACIFDPFGLREFGGVDHVADDAVNLKRPILRHQRVDKKLASARSVGCMPIPKFTPQCASNRVAYDAPMLGLSSVSVVNEVQKRLRFWRAGSNRKGTKEPAVTN
jgi:hypothetical protein